jgi:hypothetical protein
LQSADLWPMGSTCLRPSVTPPIKLIWFLKVGSPARFPFKLTKFTLSINLKTAKMLEIALPPFLLASADEVVE